MFNMMNFFLIYENQTLIYFLNLCSGFLFWSLTCFFSLAAILHFSFPSTTMNVDIFGKDGCRVTMILQRRTICILPCIWLGVLHCPRTKFLLLLLTPLLKLNLKYKLKYNAVEFLALNFKGTLFRRFSKENPESFSVLFVVNFNIKPQIFWTLLEVCCE